MSLARDIAQALRCRCPQCGEGALYQPGLTLSVRKICDHCNFALGKHDSADGPAVFLIFILGFAVTPLALFVDYLFHPPLWAHAVMWGAVLVALTVGMIRPLKAYIIMLQLRHRPRDWDAS